MTEAVASSVAYADVRGRIVCDTDLVIDYLRGKGSGTIVVRDLIRAHRFVVTAITAFELRVGADLVERRDDILRLARSRTLPFDLDCGVRGGQVAAELGRAGAPIGMADSMQAGACLRYGLPFATRNRKHFNRVSGLVLVDLPAGDVHSHQ